MNAGEQIARAADQTVLIAGEDPDMREMLADALKLMVPGITTLFAGDGLDAMAVAMDVMPWLVVLDLDMPRINGVETAERLRARMGAEVPVLIGVSADYGRLREAYGLFDYSLWKPFDIGRLAHYLARALSFSAPRTLGSVD
jgi:two-component system OmpR family response regulator